MQFDVLKNLIYLCIHGSRAYGLDTPESDYDLKGVAIPTEEYFLGYFYNFEQSINNSELHKEYSKKLETTDLDSTVYSLQKFFKLASDCNPNIIELMWVNDTDILFTTPTWEYIRENRDLFLSLKAKHTFSGYAHSQLKRIKTHRSWLLNPPKKKPERKNFKLPEEKLANATDLGALKALENSGYTINDNVMELFKKEKAYARALQHWNQYLNWKTNRNPKRAKMEKKYGFDLKHASHLVRLYRMCIEILQYGKVLVKRSDAEEIKAIRYGKWAYEDIIRESENYENLATELYEKNPANLPKTANHKKLNEICVQLHKKKLS